MGRGRHHAGQAQRPARTPRMLLAVTPAPQHGIRVESQGVLHWSMSASPPGAIRGPMPPGGRSGKWNCSASSAPVQTG